MADLNKEKQPKENLMVLMAEARGKVNKIKGLYEASKDQDERMKLKNEYADAIKAFQIVNEKYQKLF